MSFNKVYVQRKRELKKLYKEDPEGFVGRMVRAEALIGSRKAIKYIKKKINNK
jgi:hypothetical protein